MSIKRENFYNDAKAPIVNLSAKVHFDQLTKLEQFYTHYFSKASHAGTRVVLRSVSPESETIYDLILSIHQKINGDYKSLESNELSYDDMIQYLEYSSMFLSNLGNYKSFGDVKFVPKLPIDKFGKIVESLNDSSISKLYESCSSALYSVDESSLLLGWNDKGHVTGYYLNVVSQLEAELVNLALASKQILPENTRVEKVNDTKFIVHVASLDLENNTGYYPESIEFENSKGDKCTLTFKFGDHSKEFAMISSFLSEASKYARDDRQRKMLKHYVAAFKTGSMQEHWDSQIEWVLDVGPPVETNIGFIETYRDPSGVRGEWEGLVAMINKERSAKFQTLVDNAPKFIAQLPWSKDFEKDTFKAPDFTSLEVFTFAGSGIPAGINIPNYNLSVGFKNVSLGNVLSSKTSNDKVTFIEDDLQEVFNKYRVDAFEVQVGAHELLGHGTGKLLSETDDGFNFDISNPPIGINGKPISTHYKKGETWSAVFGGMSGTMEECRAELVGLYLHLSRDFLVLFGYESKEEQDKIILVSWLNMARAGLVGLEQWDPKTGKWGQPHMQARFTIFKTMLEAGLVSLEYKEADFSDLIIKLDESKIETVGKECISDYLLKLHIYKTSADVVNGQLFYNEKSRVDPDILKFRDLIMEKRLPRKQFIQANTYIEGDSVVVKEYEENEIGMIQSFVDRET